MREAACLSRRAVAAAIPLVFAGASTAPAAAIASAGGYDPVFAQIELHKSLRIKINDMPGPDDGPLYLAACADEEAAIQALGDMKPTTIAGAAAQLRYMAEVEEPFADEQSPLMRCVLTVAGALVAQGLPT